MRIRINPAPVTLLLGSALAGPAMAQSAGPLPFDVTASALSGTVACDGGPAITITPVNASTTYVTGSNNSDASNLSAQACGLQIYSISSADDSSNAQDTIAQDYGNGSSSLQNVSLLGGLVTYQSKSESDGCDVFGQTVTCQGTTTIKNLYFAGQQITGSFSSSAQFPATNISVNLPGYCTGVALFTGTLTVGGSSQQTIGNNETTTFAPIALNGTLTCVGLPLTSIYVAFSDENFISVPADATAIFDFQAPVENTVIEGEIILNKKEH